MEARKTMTIDGKEIPIDGYQKADLIEKDGSRTRYLFPVITTESNYEWQLHCLKSRLEHPESYPNEDVEAVIAYLQEWLATHEPDEQRERKTSGEVKYIPID